MRRFDMDGRLNLAPFVDLLFSLIIVCLIAMPAIMGGIEVELPRGMTQTQTVIDNALYVTVRNDGSIFVEQEETKFALLAKKLSEFSGGDLTKTIFIKGDSKLNYGDIMRVVTRINNSGFTRVILVTEDK